MRLVTLSDYAAEQIRKAQDTRIAVNDKMLADWQAAVNNHEAAVAGQAQAMRQAWRERRVLAAAVALVCTIQLRLTSKPAMPALLTAGDDEGQFQGGQHGEARVVASLSRLFDDQWVAFKGYANRGGETDLLLVGPTGVVALEVKYLNGVVHCEGNTWIRDKGDRYGNIVERGIPVRDARGRSPGQQVNATADALQAQLARRGQAVPVKRAVVLAHEASRLGRVREPGVEFIGVLTDGDFHTRFLALVQPPSGRPDLDVAALERLVRQDHEHHLRRKARRKAPGSAEAAGAAAPRDEGRLVGAHTALAKPRPIKLLPPTADAITGPSEIEVRQARALGQDIIALHRSQGRDDALDQKVRQAISGQLQAGGRYRVLSMALDPRAEHENLLLRRLIRECRQTVEFDDRTLYAIVVPVAVRWETPAGADWSGVWVSSVDRDDLRGPSLTLQLALDVQKIVFSHRLYEGGRLESLDARLLRQALMQLEVGEEPEIPELKPAVLAPSTAADWGVVYLLGVAVTQHGEPLCLDDEVRRALAGRHEMLIAGAVTGAAWEATGTPDTAQAVVEDVWTLADGVRHGRRLQRRHLLETMLASSPEQANPRGAPLRCWYAEDREAMRIRLLVDWGALRVEQELSAFGEDQPLQVFRTLLEAAIVARVPAHVRIEVQELHLYDYRRQAQVLGLSWMGQAPKGRAAGPIAPADPAA